MVSPTLVVASGVVLFVGIAAVLAWQVHTGRALDYLTLYLVVCLFDLAVHPVYLLTMGDPRELGPYLQQGYYRLYDQSMVAASLIALLHVAMVLAGYALLPLRSAVALPPAAPVPVMQRLARPRLLGAALGLVALYCGLFVVRLLTTFGSLTGFVQFYMRDRLRSLMHVSDTSAIAAELAVLGMIIKIVWACWALSLLCLAAYLLTRQRAFAGLFAGFVALLLPALVLNGYRQLFVVYGISVVVLYFAVSGRRVRWRHVAWTAGPALAFVTLLTVGQSLLMSYAYTGEIGETTDVIGALVKSLSPNMGFDALAGIASFFPDRADFLRGESLVDVLVMWIPRSIWEGKKLVYGVDYINAFMGRPTTTTTAITLPGEYYLNFSWLGVVVLSMIQGAAFRVVDALKFRTDLTLFLYLAFLSGTNAMYGMGIISVAWTGASVARMGVFLGALLLLAWILTRPGAARAPATRAAG